MRRLLPLLLFASLGSRVFAPAEAAEASSDDDAALLAKAYCRLQVVEQTCQQADAFSRQASNADLGEVKAALTVWRRTALQLIREPLETRFGREANDRFAAFVNGLATDDAPVRAAAADADVARDIDRASQWLGDAQTWLDLRRQGRDVPALKDWLARDQRATPTPADRPTRAPSDLDRLQAGEAVTTGEPPPPDPTAASPLDQFGNLRRQKRNAALQDAQAGMQQVAAERQAAEQEYAAKRQAAAQADADATRRHAQQLAAVEQEALTQRQNSWKSRIKAIVGSTVSTAGSAFFGQVGSRLGEQMTDALFDSPRSDAGPRGR